MHAILIATAALVGLPIVLHLIMKQEPKRLPFPALRFLLQKRKTNQRKMKLRHFLLLALRMLLIALFGLTIFQPILPSTGLEFASVLAGKQPVAAVIILDTSPSMSYQSGGQTRLADAQRRALELLNDLPSGSKVAVIDPLEVSAIWQPSESDARRAIEAIKEPHGAAVPVTSALATAYRMLQSLDPDEAPSQRMPRLVAVFSDRATACWDATRRDDLARLRDSVPEPAVAHLFVDVGVDQPADVAIATADLKPQVTPQGQPVVLNATLTAAGPGVDATVRCKVTPAFKNAPPIADQTKQVILAGNGTATASFELRADQLRPGLYQAELRLETPDNLAFDNVRYITFKVAEPRKILAITNDEGAAKFWRLAHDVIGEFDCDVLEPKEIGDTLSKYEAVAILNVTDPTALWPKLLAYVEGGGKLIIIPGGEGQVLNAAYQSTANADAAKLLPGSLKNVMDVTETVRGGAPWKLSDDALRHPLLAPFNDWKLRGNVDFIVYPRRAWKFWAVDAAPDSSVVVRYDTDPDAAKCPAAILERIVGTKGGKVLLLTTRLDTPPKVRAELWNDYLEFDNNSWYMVFPNLLMRYLAGSTTDTVLNFTTGQSLPTPTPRGGTPSLRIEGPGVTVDKATITPAQEPALQGERTATAGNFRVFTPDKTWQDGFSLNPPPEESSLLKVPADAIESLCGPGSVVPVDRKLSLYDVLKLNSNQQLELFPWLLMAVLFLIVFESYVANCYTGNEKQSRIAAIFCFAIGGLLFLAGWLLLIGDAFGYFSVRHISSGVTIAIGALLIIIGKWLRNKN